MNVVPRKQDLSVEAALRQLILAQPPNRRDPTATKPFIVLLWLRNHMQLLCDREVIEQNEMFALVEVYERLVTAVNGIDKIDKMVLPLPYCQLLKIFMLFFVFTLPFPIAPATGLWTIPVTILCTIGFFGLDSVAAELECPFGVDDNDLPMLKMADNLLKDIDALVETVHASKLKARWASHSRQSHTHARSVHDREAAEHHFGWGKPYADDGTDADVEDSAESEEHDA